MRVALLADFPVHTLPGFDQENAGHHATWLPPLARELKSRCDSFDLHWITCTKHVSEPVTLRAWNQTFHLIPRHRLSVEMLTGYRRERRLIRQKLAAIAPDLVHAWGTEQGYALAATDFPGPSLISVQGILHAYCQAASMPWLTRIQARHEARALRRTRQLTVESPWGKSQLQPLAPNATVQLLEYGVDPACFEIQRSLSAEPRVESLEQDEALRPISDLNQLSSLPPRNSPFSDSSSPDLRPSDLLPFRPPATELPASSPPPLAIFVGSLTRLKGVDTLLTAFSDPRLRHVRLALLGSGEAAFSHQLPPPNITFLGHLPADHVRAWMARSWCLVHPTRADTSPNCVKEARVIGLPVVTTPNGGQTQYVDHGQSGYIHPAGDVEGLIQGILTVTANRETSLRMGSAGQAECRAALTPATTATRLLEIYAAI